MGLRILVGRQAGYDGVLDEQAVLFDSVTDTAFGRLFSSDERNDAREVAEAFLDWAEHEGVVRGDVRNLPIETTIGLQDEFLRLRREVVGQ